MKSDSFEYYVAHPRYGKRPRITGFDPDLMDPEVNLHWNATSGAEIRAQYKAATGEDFPFAHLLPADQKEPARIPATAIRADLKRQSPATVPVTHYYDLKRVCRDCDLPFIFFADEQQYWYESLGFPLEADCVRCTECRKKVQALVALRTRYDKLIHVDPRSDTETTELIDAALTLVENAVFGKKVCERLRACAKKLPKNRRDALMQRIRAAEAAD